MVNVGEVWQRKSPVDDDEWNRVEVRGVQPIANEQPDEYVVAPVGGIETVSVSEADLRAVFVLEIEAGPQPPIGGLPVATALGEGWG